MKRKSTSSTKSKRQKTSLQESFQRRLEGAQFRTLNEELYTKTGDENLARFSAEPELAEAYHRGFREQTSRWPSNPLDAIIAALAKQKKCAIADLGCGDARIAEELGERHAVHSFDLVATRPGVVACNIAKTPLEDASVDVAVFCLALMGPSFLDFLREAGRVLRTGGVLKIAEVRSRFDEKAGGIEKFLSTLKALGFDLVGDYDASNSHFLAFDFVKSRRPPNLGKVRKAGFAFKPCLYKRR